MPDETRTTISVQRYNPSRGAVADVEGGTVRVSIDTDGVVICGDRAGLRDLARWCLAVSDDAAPDGTHVHLDPNVSPLGADSVSLTVSNYLRP